MTAAVPQRDRARVSDQDSTAVPGATLSAEERDELERLRAEVTSLRSQAAATPSETVVVVPARRPRQRWRSVVATLLIVIGVTALAAAVERWV